jgi:hypothetical protein
MIIGCNNNIMILWKGLRACAGTNGGRREENGGKKKKRQSENACKGMRASHEKERKEKVLGRRYPCGCSAFITPSSSSWWWWWW